jgi:hypothetical protein
MADTPQTGRVIEQMVALKGLDFQNGVACLTVRGKFDLRDTEVYVPFALFDVVELQRLMHKLQQNGTLPAPVPDANGARTH